MRGFLGFISFVIAAVIVAALAIFAVQNGHGALVFFLGFAFIVRLWWIAIGAAILGFVLAFILLAPGRVAAGWRGRSLRRESDQLRQELADVRARREQLEREHERLRTEYQQVAAERDRLRSQPVTPQAPSVPATAASTAQPAQPVPSMTAAQSSQPASAAQPEQPVTSSVMPSGPANTNGSPVTTTATYADEERPPTLGERMRGALGRHPRPEDTASDDQTGYPEGPTAPTA